MSNLRLTIDLLPKGAWGNDFSKTLPKKDWDTLRNHCYQKAKGVCAICGKKTDELDAHEVWEFDTQSKTQTLKDIIALCSACHGVKHMRNSERIGYGEQSKVHFLKVNGCTSMTFAKHYAEAQFLFDQRNKVLRWNIAADLSKFGGEGIEFEQKQIPFIISPYENIDWETVRHIRLNEQKSDSLEVIKLTQYDNTSSINTEALYFIDCNQNSYPPKIDSITVDNYEGTITVRGDRTNKIQWFGDNKPIKSKYHFSGKIKTKLCVENMTYSTLKFVLQGNGGQTFSQDFKLKSI